MITDTRLTEEPEVLATKGVRENGDKTFLLPFTGAEIYDLLHLLEGHAVKCDHYLKARAFVLAAEMLRQRAREQGF